MPNQEGRYSSTEAASTGLPIYIPRSKRWNKTPYEFAVLLSKSRCKHFGVPILPEGREAPSAFIYCANAGTGTNDKGHRFVPLYDRTEALHEIGLDNLIDREIMKGS